MPALEAQQGTQAWLEARKGHITASLAAACLGLDPHTSRQKAWRTIMGTEPQRDNHHMKWGREFEETARNDYECLTGNLVSPGGFWAHPMQPWLLASPDGLIGADGLVEIKCPTDCPEEVPPHHEIQMRVQMCCTGRKWCDYFSWAKGGHFMHRVELRGADELIADLAAFYKKYVLGNLEPERKKRGAAA